MTIQEKAIEQLERISEHLSAIGEKEDYTDIAIKALEQQQDVHDTCIEDYPTCTECEHYDSEKHYCPRFCQVIKDTLSEAQPKKDLVSKADVIHHIAEQYIQHNELVPPWLTIGDMPAVQPKKGKWIVFRCGDTDIYKCSECGMRVMNPYQYCPNCGAKMEVEDE